jgi:hypothetical protein
MEYQQRSVIPLTAEERRGKGGLLLREERDKTRRGAKKNSHQDARMQRTVFLQFKIEQWKIDNLLIFEKK